MTAPDVVVELTAAAETLRERAEAVRARLLAAGFDEYVEEKTREDRALATMIDGMLRRHTPTEVYESCEQHHPDFPEEACETGEHTAIGCGNCIAGWDDDQPMHPLFPCPDLTALATYTRTVLGSTQ